MRLPRRFAPRSDKLVLHFLFAIANHSFSFVITSLPKVGTIISYDTTLSSLCHCETCWKHVVAITYIYSRTPSLSLPLYFTKNHELWTTNFKVIAWQSLNFSSRLTKYFTLLSTCIKYLSISASAVNGNFIYLLQAYLYLKNNLN